MTGEQAGTRGLSDKYLLAETKLGQPLAGWIKNGRDAGTSWRKMAADLTRLTGVQVSDVTLAVWAARTSHSVTYQVDPFDLCR